MKPGLVAVLIALAVPSLALAQDAGKYRCTQGDMVRRVEILTEPGVVVPCEVHYYRDTEAPGQQQVLWTAQNQAGYCEAKVDGFLAMLEGYGWDCGRGDSDEAEAMPAPTPEAPAEEEIRDDTDVLSPGSPEG